MGILARQPERKKGAVIDVHLVRDPFLRAFFLVALLGDCLRVFVLIVGGPDFTETRDRNRMWRAALRDQRDWFFRTWEPPIWLKPRKATMVGAPVRRVCGKMSG